MGNLDRLLDALARKLPRTADAKAIAAALRAAVEALPESQAKTREKVRQSEQQCVEHLKAQLKAAKEAGDTAPNAVEGSEASDEGSSDPYANVDSDDIGALARRCAELLSDAISSLRPASCAQEAVEGLLAATDPEKDTKPVGGSTLASCVRLLPAILAASGGQESPALRRYLGFLVSASARLQDSPESQAAASQLGGIIALAASPAAARAALRLGLQHVQLTPGSPAISRLLPVMLPAISTAFRRASLAKEEARRGDLLALLHGLRFMSLCQRSAPSSESLLSGAAALSEARALLRTALECHFDASLLQLPLQRLASSAIGSASRKAGSGPAVAASAALESFDAAAASITPAVIARLADCHGLPVGQEEEEDRVVVAQAAGGLFFEDTAGGDLMDTMPDKGDDEAAATKAAEAIADGAFERLEGVERLQRRKRPSLKLKVKKAQSKGTGKFPGRKAKGAAQKGKGKGKGKGKSKRLKRDKAQAAARSGSEGNAGDSNKKPQKANKLKADSASSRDSKAVVRKLRPLLAQSEDSQKGQFTQRKKRQKIEAGQ